MSIKSSLLENQVANLVENQVKFLSKDTVNSVWRNVDLLNPETNSLLKLYQLLNKRPIN